MKSNHPLLAFIFLSAFSISLQAQERTLRLGVVFDGAWERNQEISALLQKEIAEVMAGEVNLQFPPDKTLAGDWTLAGVKKLNDRLLADPAVDLIIGFGVFASQDLAQRGPLPKPVIAPVVVEPRLQGIPNKGGMSGVHNLNYLKIPVTLERDIKFFQEIVSFKKITIIGSKRYFEGLPSLRVPPEQMERMLGVKITEVYIDASADEALTALPQDAEAVYIQPILHLAPAEFTRLVNGINARRLPSFSAMGESEVNQGVLAALNPDILPRIIRRIALNVHRILDGEDPGGLPVDFPAGKRLFMNIKTAMTIGVSPTWATLLEAELFDIDTSSTGRPRLTLHNAVRSAIENNLDISAKAREVRAGAQTVRMARASLLPQLEVSGTGSQIDRDRVLGTQPERSASASATLSQLIFSEPAWANLSIQSSLQRSRESEYDQLQLDITLDASTAYLNVLRAQKIMLILLDNVKITRTNLEIAQIRETTGSAGPGEPLRWESEVATSRKNVMEAHSRMAQAGLLLNQILHRRLDEEFTAAEVALDDPALLTSKPHFLRHLDNPLSFERLSAFMVKEGLSHAPEIQQIDALRAAQKRTLTSQQLSFFAPTISTFGEYTNNFYRGGKNAGATLPYDKNDWVVGLQLSLPLFTGFSRAASREKASQELQQQEAQRQAIAERIELRIRSEMQNIKASYFGIQQSRLAAEAAQKNYDIVADSYSQGSLPIINLLDAQNAALLSNQVAANALYDFLIDYMNMQRAIGQFDVLQSAADREAFAKRLAESMKSMKTN